MAIPFPTRLKAFHWFLLASLAPAAAQELAPDGFPVAGTCIAPMQSVLGKVADCMTRAIAIRSVGNILAGNAAYTVFDMRYRDSAEGPHQTGQKILLVQDGRRYLGQYALAVTTPLTLSIRGNSVVTDAPAGDGNEIRIDQYGPPPEIYLGGLLYKLYQQ